MAVCCDSRVMTITTALSIAIVATLRCLVGLTEVGRIPTGGRAEQSQRAVLHKASCPKHCFCQYTGLASHLAQRASLRVGTGGGRRQRRSRATANLCTKMLDFKAFDSSRILVGRLLIWRSGAPDWRGDAETQGCVLGETKKREGVHAPSLLSRIGLSNEEMGDPLATLSQFPSPNRAQIAASHRLGAHRSPQKTA